MGFSQRWMSEDGFHYLRIAEQIQHGHGPVFNADQRVESATSPTWVWILALLGWLLPFVPLERVAVTAGLVASGLGLWWAQRGAVGLWERGEPANALWLPLGAWTIAALPVAWDWSTSGMETSLCMAWIGAVTLRLARISARKRFASIADGCLLGLGPLVRPDLALLSGAALVAVVWIHRPSLRRAWPFLAGFVALPLAYEVFRAGYYATLLPNTALAKHASGQYWGQGWNYLIDLLLPYWLCVPLAAAALAFGLRVRGAARPAVVATLALVLGGLLHALYITRSGGCYLSGRLLIPSLFTVMAPLAAVPWRRAFVAPIAIVGLWACAAALVLRPTIDPLQPLAEVLSFTSRGVLDGRESMALQVKPGRAPVLALDLDTGDGEAARRLQAEGRRALVIHEEVHLDVTPVRTTLISSSSGISGFVAGPEVRVHQTIPLSNPVASRMLPLRRSRPGHRKRESWPWSIAQTTRPGVTAGRDPAKIEAARRALGCGELAELLAAISEPLDAARFWSNLRGAYRRTRLQVPRRPEDAERVFCDPAGGSATSVGDAPS